MNTLNTTFSSHAAALRIPRFVIALSLALAVLAIPAFSPDGAGAMYMSEIGARRACGQGGGTVHYQFFDQTFTNYSMTCSLPGGAHFVCYSGDASGVDCF